MATTTDEFRRSPLARAPFSLYWVFGLVLASCASPTPSDKPGEVSPQAAARVAVDNCSVCHGPGGRSSSANFPRLAGQREEYLEAQLKAFKGGHGREEQDALDFMRGVAGGLSEPMIEGLAHYYAAQPPAPGIPGDPALTAKGKELFEKGIPAKGIPACASCHGANGQGVAAFPRLAGQHAQYLVKQLQWIQNVARKAPVMHVIVQDMTREEMEALAVYLQSI